MGGRTEELGSLFPTPTTDELVAQTDRQLVEARELEGAILAKLAEARGHISTLEAARRELLKKRHGKVERPRSKSVRTAAGKAGKGNVTLVRELMQRLGTATKAQVTTELEKNNGTITYAMRALEEDGVIAKTGHRIHGSDEYRYVSRRRAVTKPGD